MIDIFGRVVSELADDAVVASLSGNRVRGHQPGPDDAKGAGEYLPFVVLTDLGGIPLTRTPVQFALISIRCYGVTPQGAKALYVACSNALHAIGPRTHGTVGIYHSQDTTGGSEGDDPRTKQPYIEFTAQFIASTTAVAA